MTTDRPIFLVGCPRSGTTLLSTMLHSHPRIAMPPETRFLIPLYLERAELGDLAVPANRRELALRITGRKTRFKDLGLERRTVIKAIVDAPPTIGSAAGAVWREFARSRGKARWGEKRPAYWRDMNMVMRLFPDAQVIHLVRDGRACLASLRKLDWWKAGLFSTMTTWSLADRELNRFGRKAPAGSYYRLRYEDLLADPRTVLGGLCAYLGEDFDEAMLSHADAARDIVPDRKTWHVLTKGDVDPSRIEAWRRDLTPRQIGVFEAVAGRRLRKNGYVTGTTPGAFAPWRDRWRYYRIYIERVIKIAGEHRDDARAARIETVPVADLGG